MLWADRHTSRGAPISPYHITKASYALLVLRSERLAIGRLQRNVVPLHRIISFTTCALAVSPAAQAHLPWRTDLLLFISSRQSRTTHVSDAGRALSASSLSHSRATALLNA